MTRRPPSVSLLVFGAALLGGSGCDKLQKVERRATNDWVTGQRMTIGSCEFTLDHAWLKHQDDWRGGVTMKVKNVGEQPTRCGWDATIIGASQKSVSNHDGKAEELAPGAERTSAAALNATWSADASPHDAWLWIGLFEGAGVSGKTPYNVANPAVAPAMSIN